MKQIKKIALLLTCIIALLLVFPLTTFAWSIYPSQDYVSIGVGESVTVEVCGDMIFGTYSVSCEGPISASGGGGIEFDSGDGTYNSGYVEIYGQGLGTGVVYVDYNIATYDSEESVNNGFTIYVDVVESTFAGEAKPEEDTKFDVTIGDKKYTIVNDFSNIELPKGFTKADGTYGTEKVCVAKYISSDKEEIVLYALAPKEGGDVKFMTFNSSKAEFTEPKMLKQGDTTYFLLNIPSSYKVPNTYQTKEIILGNFSANGIVSKDSKNSDFVYFYALVNGEEGFYSYDTKEGSIQRCTDLEKEFNSKVEVKETKNNVNKTMVIIIVVAIVAVLAMGAFLIIYTLKKKKEDKLNELEVLEELKGLEDEQFENIEEIEELNKADKSNKSDEIDIIDLSDKVDDD